MVNDLIEKELKRVEKADLTHFNPETNTYFIPKRKDIKIEEDNCYLIRLKDTIFNNETLKVNWNGGSLPTYKYLKVDVSKIMAKMIKVVGVGFDNETQTDVSYFWSGWLTLDEIEVIKKI